MIDGQLVSDVPAGEVITSFVQAALGAHEVALQVARQRVVDRLGWERFVDLTAVMAMFELNTRAADARILLEAPSVEGRNGLAKRFGFDARSGGFGLKVTPSLKKIEPHKGWKNPPNSDRRFRVR